TSVINFVQKDFAEMFPRWDFAENIIKVMFNTKANWNWTMNCWEVTVPRKKARKAASVEAWKVPSVEASKVPSAEARAEARSEASTEIKLLRDRLKAVEKKSESVNGAKAGQNGGKAGQNDPQEPKHSGEPRVLVLDNEVPTDSDLQKGEIRSERARKLAASQQTPFQGNNTAKVIIPNKRVKLDHYFKTPMDKKPRRRPSNSTEIIHIISGARDCAFFIMYFFGSGPISTRNLRTTRATSTAYEEDSQVGRRIIMQAWNEHWIAIWISISKRHIVVWDSILTHIKAADLDVLMEPFVNMVPYLLVEVTVGVPQCRAEFCNKNAKAIREKMALAIFQETPEGLAKENEDNDENMGTYDEQG
ncbi:unnamed protein product, partial [Brassica napus]